MRRRSPLVTWLVATGVIVGIALFAYLVELPLMADSVLIPVISGMAMGTWVSRRMMLHCFQRATDEVVRLHAVTDEEARLVAHRWARSNGFEVIPPDCDCEGCRAALR